MKITLILLVLFTILTVLKAAKHICFPYTEIIIVTINNNYLVVIYIYLYHYYDKTVGPFVNLSELSIDEAKSILDTIKATKPNSQCAQRHDKYVEYRHNCESIIRSEFAKKGGAMTRTSPHYMVIEHSPWLSTWYENSAFIKIPIEEFDEKTISFTYGDSMPTFSPTINDGKEYRRKLYTYDEILKVIEKYGLPQDWNDDGKYGPERYIEVHVWSNETIDKYRSKEKVEKTIFAYNQNSNTFNNRFMEFPPYLVKINEFANLLETGKKLLDLGCGPGNVIKQILSTGKEFDVVGVDLSQEMLKLARINVPTGSFICEDIRTVDFPDNTFDVILLSFCIVHLEGSELNTFFQRISRFLRKEGKIYLSFMEGKNDGYEKTSFSEDEIYFNYHASDDVITLLEENNILIINVTKQGYIEKSGSSTTDVFVFAGKL